MVTKKNVTPDFNDFWASLDTASIEAEIAPPGITIADFDYEHAKACIYAAAERWLVWDLENLVVTNVEDRFDGVFGNAPFKAFLDLAGVTKEKPPFKNLQEFGGVLFEVDWKTAQAALDTRWSSRQVGSWQWREYAFLHGGRLFFYRGIRRPQEPGSDPETRELILEVPETNAQEVKEFIEGVAAMRNALVQIGAEVWPRHMPSACNAYGRECPYLADCQNYTMPRQALLAKVLSYSALDGFLQCPERHRRDILTDAAESGDNDATAFGRAVHRGLAEVWRQAFKLPKSEETRG